MMEHSTAYSSMALRVSLMASAPDLSTVGEREIHHSNGPIDERFSDEEQHGHIGDFFAHQAEIADRLAEGFTLLGIADGILQRDAARHRRTSRPA